MKASYLIAGAITVFSILWIVSGTLTGTPPGPESQNAAAPEKKKIVSVRVRDIAAEEVTTDIAITGKSFASREVELQAETEGQVTDILAEKGAAVTEGTVIARLKQRDRKARVEEAKQRVAQREIEYNASRELETKGFNSKVRLSQSLADLEAARAELKRAQVDLDDTEITAPFDGVLYEQFIEKGAYVASGTPLFSIVDLDPVEIRGYVTEQQVREVKTGVTATATFLNGKNATGTITYVSPAADPATRTFIVEAKVPNPDQTISQGMTAQILIPTSTRRLHRISPSVLSLDDDGRVGVKIVKDDNTVAFMPVEIADDRPDHMMVGGLPEKVRLITVGQDFVAEGQTVDPQPATGDGLL